MSIMPQSETQEVKKRSGKPYKLSKGKSSITTLEDALNVSESKIKESRAKWESYWTNTDWLMLDQGYFYLNLDRIKYCPLEELTVEYWQDRERAILESAKQSKPIRVATNPISSMDLSDYEDVPEYSKID